MKNKRRDNTQTRRAGTETGSVTFTVTFYPDRDPRDQYIVDNLTMMKGVGTGASGWLRQAAIEKAYGQTVSGPEIPQVKTVQREKPVEGVSDKVADSMGLKFGKKRE